MNIMVEVGLFLLTTIGTTIVGYFIKMGLDSLAGKKNERNSKYTNNKNSNNNVKTKGDSIIGDNGIIDKSKHTHSMKVVNYYNYTSSTASTSNDELVIAIAIFLLSSVFGIAAFAILIHYDYFNFALFTTLFVLVLFCYIGITVRYPSLTIQDTTTRFYVVLIGLFCASYILPFSNILMSDAAIELEKMIIISTSSFSDLTVITSNFWSYEMLQLGFKIIMLLYPIAMLLIEIYTLIIKKRTFLLYGASEIRCYFSFILIYLLLSFFPSIIIYISSLS